MVPNSWSRLTTTGTDGWSLCLDSDLVCSGNQGCLCSLQKASEFRHIHRQLDATPESVQALCQGVEHSVKGVTGVEVVRVTTAGTPKYYCDLSQMGGEGLERPAGRSLLHSYRPELG